MTRAKRRKQQQSCDVAKVIDAIEEAVDAALKIHRAVQPITKAIIAIWGKTK